MTVADAPAAAVNDASAPATKRPSIYEKLGGSEAVSAAVDIFYERVLADPRINHFFTNIDMRKQRAKQLMFMIYAFGGPEAYHGRSLREAHAHLNLTDAHFTAVAECFVATLQQLGVAQDLIDEAVAVVATTKAEVLNQ